MDRVLRNTPTTISQTFYSDGVIADPGVVTVDVVRADGTVLVNNGATTGTGAAARSYNLTTTHTAQLDSLTVTWTSPDLGESVTYVEVAGGFLFSLGEARALPELSNATDYPFATIAEYRTLAEQAFEDAAGVAFVPRYTLETVNGTNEAVIGLRWPRIRSVRSITIDDEAQTDLSDVAPFASNSVYFPAGFARGYGNVTVGYEHGYDTPPARVSRAVLLLAKDWLVKGPVDDRAIAAPAGEVGGSIPLLTPGVRGSVFGLPEVDAVLKQYGTFAGVG
jgi:hypothetical protein